MLKRIFLFLGFALPAFAQAPDTMWTRSVGFIINSIAETPEHNIAVLGDSVLLLLDPNGDSLGSISYGGLSFDVTKDSGFIIAGDSLVKIDSSGSFAWSKPIKGNLIITCIDSGYLLSSALDTGRLIRTDDYGTIIWDKKYPHWISQVKKTKDDGFICTGAIDSSNKRVLLMKIDGAGDILWSHSFSDSTSDEIGNSIVELPNLHYVILGDINKGEPLSLGSLKYIIIETDSLGNLVSQNELIPIDGRFGYYQKATGIKIINYNNALMAIGEYEAWSFYATYRGSWLFALDSLYNETWHEQFQHNDYFENDFLIEYKYDKSFVFGWGSNIRKYKPEEIKILRPQKDYTHKLNLTLINPVGSKLKIDLESGFMGDINLNLFDLKGRIVAVVYNGLITEGKHSFLYNVLNIPSGIYYVECDFGLIKSYYGVIILH